MKFALRCELQHEALIPCMFHNQQPDDCQLGKLCQSSTENMHSVDGCAIPDGPFNALLLLHCLGAT